MNLKEILFRRKAYGNKVIWDIGHIDFLIAEIRRLKKQLRELKCYNPMCDYRQQTSFVNQLKNIAKGERAARKSKIVVKNRRAK